MWLQVLSGLHHLTYIQTTVVIGFREMQQDVSKNRTEFWCSLGNLASDHNFEHLEGWLAPAFCHGIIGICLQ